MKMSIEVETFILARNYGDSVPNRIVELGSCGALWRMSDQRRGGGRRYINYSDMVHKITYV